MPFLRFYCGCRSSNSKLDAWEPESLTVPLSDPGRGGLWRENQGKG